MIGANDITVVMGSLPGREDLRKIAVQSVRRQSIGRPQHLAFNVDYEGLGCGAMKNCGLRQTPTPWAAFLDDDDWMFPDHLAALAWAADDTGADLVYSRPWVYNDDDGTHEDWPDIPFDADRLRAGNYIPCGYMVRTELAREVGGFPERTPEVPYSDWGFLLRLLDAGATFAYVPDVTWAFRRWSGNTSSWGAHPGVPTSNAVGRDGDFPTSARGSTLTP